VFSELNTINDWLSDGGAVLVQGKSSDVTNGLASIFDINYESGECTSGTTTDMIEHPITKGVSTISVKSTCDRLAPSTNTEIVVFDPQSQPHLVAQEQDGGKMVVVASEDFIDWQIDNEDNRLLAINTLDWLSHLSYSDLPWLSVTPNTITIPGRSSMNVQISFDATALSLGEYQATLILEHNDSSQSSSTQVPVTLTVLLPELYLPLIQR
jgi:hypothetical protein